MARMVSFFLLVGIILLLGAIFFRVMATFLVPLFFAAVFVFVFRPVHDRLLQRLQGKRRTAAALTTLTILLAVLVPAVLVLALAAIEAGALMTRLDVGTIKGKLARLREAMGLEMPAAGQVREIEDTLRRLYAAQEKTQPLEDQAGTSPRSQQERIARLSQLIDGLAADAGSVERAGRREAEGPSEVFQPLQASISALQAAPPGTLAHEAAMQVSMREFRDLKLTLWGGPYRAWLIDLANPSDEDLRSWSGRAFNEAQDWLLSVGGATTAFAARVALGLAIMVISIYFFLIDGPGMVRAMMRLSPLDDRYERELLQEFDRTSRAVVLATLLAALAQGLLAGFGYWLAGVHSVFLLMVLTAIMALVPFVGAGSVWIPVCIWVYLYDERTAAAVFLAIYGAAIVSMADNIIKPLVLHGQSRLHPLLALLSVLGGVQALGPMGILVGPMVVVFLQTLLKLLNQELVSLDGAAEKRGSKAAATDGRGQPAPTAAASEDQAAKPDAGARPEEPAAD